MTTQEKIALEELLRQIESSDRVVVPDERSLFDRTLSRASGAFYDLQRRIKPERDVPISNLGIRG